MNILLFSSRSVWAATYGPLLSFGSWALAGPLGLLLGFRPGAPELSMGRLTWAAVQGSLGPCPISQLGILYLVEHWKVSDQLTVQS